MARTAKPRQGETLAAYLDRLLEERSLKLNELARTLSAEDGASEDTWQRTLRRWTAGGTVTMSEDNAALLGTALNADLSAYVRGTNGNGVKDLLTQALERIEALEARLAALERP